MGDDSRRAFIARASAGSAAILAGGGVAATASDKPKPAGKSVVEGSPYPTFSRATVFDGIVYVAGVVGQLPGTRTLASPEFAGQCRQALENLKASVEASGSSMDQVLKCNCFLTDAADFATFNRIYVEYFPSKPPARSTVIVKALVVEGAKLEIDCVTCLT